MEQHSELRKNIGFSVATSIVIGTVIGSGIFMKPGIILSSAGNSKMAMLAWIIGGIITLASGLTISEISVKIPKTGGLYAYLETVYGKLWGFLCGWIQSLIYAPAVIGALGLYFGSIFADLFGIEQHNKIWIGIMVVLFLTILNLLGTKYGGFIQIGSTIGKMVPIFLIAIFGLWKGNGNILMQESGVAADHISMGAAVLATLWAYDGWINVGFMAGEMKNPSKTLPKAIISGILFVMFAYIAVNAALFHVLSGKQIVHLGANSASYASQILFGPVGSKLITIGILISIFGCLNGKLLTFPRIPYAMAESKLVPASRFISWVHPKSKTPVGATVLVVIISLILMLCWDPDRLSNIAIFSVFTFYGLAFFALFILRKRDPDNGRNLYKVPLYPVTPIIAILGVIYIVGSTLIDSPKDTILSIICTIIGLPVYKFMIKRNHTASLPVVSAIQEKTTEQ
ncbi:APC family permease [Heyndrickxia ginsengihumi]|uniref:Amino acid permease n=1 Tax=Heyndrickxia ginsengihumi TaxID=363870 RepID=A0A6M0P2G2_9BACI|nr:amino acid permease [Heyndrickxia ginsengihumi]MBE6183588.1 amino acid permease [Bacillus sp. (in: firmicutes)]MCM3024945.1 amino acid permease [Heyndrickxia ginsengihumi]NEY18731.1 amino acid permease [Heyndrickxia ginsengihumi]